jgi:hypothetical protein
VAEIDKLPSAIRQVFEATNAKDSGRFLAAFAPDALLDDWGRSFAGHKAIAKWNAAENIGVDSHFEVLGYKLSNGVHTVSIQVSGGGYNGGGAMAFALASDGLILRMDITG